MKNMSTFNSADIAAFTGGVWVFCEQRQGKMMSTSYELISEGRKLADERGTKLYGLLLGDGIEGIAQELGGYGADGVYVCDHPLLKEYTTDAYTKVICDVVEEFKPEVLLIGATNIGRDLGPRCAARLHTGLTADCTHLDIDMDTYVDFLRNSSTLDVDKIKFDMEDTNLKMTRPAFGGHLMATIICPRFRPCMATVRPGVMKKAAFDQAKADACEIIKPSFALSADEGQSQADPSFPKRVWEWSPGAERRPARAAGAGQGRLFGSGIGIRGSMPCFMPCFYFQPQARQSTQRPIRSKRLRRRSCAVCY